MPQILFVNTILNKVEKTECKRRLIIGILIILLWADISCPHLCLHITKGINWLVCFFICILIQ